MSSWGKNRRNSIIFIIAAIIILLISIVGISIYLEPSTCFDGEQNGGENGVDCGGSCTILCEQQAIDPIVHWKRYFEVAPGIYNVVAYVENQNSDAIARDVEYVFELIDSDNVPLDTRSGRVDIKPKEIIPILETNLNTGKLSPNRTSFEFTSDIIWEKEDIQEKVIVIRDEKQFEVSGLPRISAEVKNISVRPVKDITVLVIVYDDRDNALSTSSTYLEAINKSESRTVNFTWPTVFVKPVGRFEIIPLYETNL